MTIATVFRRLHQPTAVVTEGLIYRWGVVVGAVLIQLSLGALYAWSVFTKDLERAPFSFSRTQTQAIFSVALASFAAMAIVGGRWQSRVAPAVVARAGAVLLSAGYVLARYVGASFPGLLLSLGVVAGAGIGLAYVVPIAVGVKWFPDKKGLITGLAVAGFGFGALLWVQLAGPWGGLIERMGVSQVFFYYGLAFFVLIHVGSLVMHNPPAGWTPPGWEQASRVSDNATARTADFEPRAMLRTRQFWMLWAMYVCGAMAGLMIIGIIKQFGMDAMQQRGGVSEAAAAATAATAMGVFFAVFNGGGRIAWGVISDAVGRKRAIGTMLALQGAVVLAFYYLGGVPAMLFVCAACVGFNFGGTLALMPAITADYFGDRNVGKNYGWMFTAYGVGGILGPIMAARLADSFRGQGVDAWRTAFLLAAGACWAAAALTVLLRAPNGGRATAG